MTPVYKIKIAKSNIAVWAKPENQNPTGTHKDRSMKPWIERCAKQGAGALAISSSGNSAISAGRFCEEAGIALHVFVSPKIGRDKLARIRGYQNVSLYETQTPNKDAFRFSRARGIANLRASRDNAALEGYKEIARELTEQLPDAKNIFIPTSSGATLEGIYAGYVGCVGGKTPHIKIPAFFAVQTAKVHPIAEYFDRDFTPQDTSRAGAIVDKVAHRRDRVIEIIKKTGGGGFVISDKELEKARSKLPGTVPGKIGVHSLLAFAGYTKWRAQNPPRAEAQTSVCLFTD